MRLLLVAVVLLCTPPAAWAGKVQFLEDRFSLEFPDDWKKADGINQNVLLTRISPDDEASFTVNALALPENAKADLAGTLETFLDSVRQGGLTIPDDAKGKEGKVDGKDALFAAVPADAGGQGLTLYLVYIDARDHVILLQATLPRPAEKKLQATTLGIIQSFHEKGPDDEKKPDEGDEKEK